MCVPSFNLQGITVPEKSVTKNFNVKKLERKKNEEIKGWIWSSSLIPVHKRHLPTVQVCTKFNLQGLTGPEKSVMKNFNVWKLERKKNEEIERQISSSSLIPVYILYICPLSMCVPSFNFQGLTVPEKSVTKHINIWKLERKKNEEIKRWLCCSSLIPVHTIHLPTVHMCTKFQPSRPHYSWEKCAMRVAQFR